jgi:glycosyltransferase involved in cell wall biosynthesis
MRREKVDVVHTHNLGPMVYGALGAKFAGIRTIINTRHGREKKETYAFFWNMNDAIIAISKDAKRRLVAFNLFDYAKLTVIYNGIRATSLKTDERAIKENIFGIDSKCKVAGTVSRLSEEKGQIVLLDAFSEVLQAVKDVRLVFVGDGPLKERLIEHSKELGIADKVIFLGFRKDAVEIMRAFDIFVLPSMTEGISLSLLEAMAAGKPTVVTHVGGNPEIVIHEVTGFLISPQALGKLSDAIIKLLQDEGLSKKMGEAGKKCVEESFTLDRMVDEYRSLYENCFSRKIMKRKV